MAAGMVLGLTVLAIPGTSGALGPPAPPRHVVVLGDSMALNLSMALTATAPPQTSVETGATFGCGLAMGSEISAYPPRPGLPSAPACNEGTPPAARWPALDARAVADTGPGDVVVFLAGHDDTTDILQHGRWRNITMPAFQRDELGQLRELIALSTVHGARIELFTLPCTNTGFAYHLRPQPDDRPPRRQIYNDLLRRAARASSGRASVIDFGRLVCPSGRFQLSLGGVQVRSRDGVHLPSYSAGNPYVTDASPAIAERFYRWLGPRIWSPLLRGQTA